MPCLFENIFTSLVRKKALKSAHEMVTAKRMGKYGTGLPGYNRQILL